MTGEKEKWRRAGGCREGFTLVEILVSVLVLAVLAIGGAAIILRSRADIVEQQYKRAAIEVANARMEELMRNWDYTNLAARVGSPIVQTVGLNGITNFTMTTTVADGGAGADNCLRVTVGVVYRQGTGHAVTLETLRSK